MTKVNFELVTDIDDLLFWEMGCRGGVSQIRTVMLRPITHI